MSDVPQIEHDILAPGRVDGQELEALRGQVYAAGKTGRREADFLVGCLGVRFAALDKAVRASSPYVWGAPDGRMRALRGGEEPSRRENRCK